jgi:MFS transporter, SP family, arabinose:H+ symporter
LKHSATDSTLPDKWYLMIAASVAGLGGLLFGYDNIVISGAIRYLSGYFHLDLVQVGWAAGCALVGCITGSAAAGTIVDRIGLKKGLFLCAGCFLGSSAGMLFAGSFTQFVFWRLLGGLGIGAASIISPMYVAEVAPTRLRGRLVTLYQLGIVLGILAAVFVNMLIQRMGDDAWNTATAWRWMFFAGIVPAILFAIMIVPALESPRWLMKTGERDEAYEVLSHVNGSKFALSEASAIQASLATEEGRISELFNTFRRPLLLGIMLAGFSQLSGITPLFSFLPEIFRAAGTATTDAFFQSVLVSLLNLVFTLFALWLVDRVGRKTLIVAGTLTQCLSFACVGWLYHVGGSGQAILVFFMTFVAGHAFGHGVACWVIISEIYPTKVRGRAMSIATTALWLVGYFGNQTFPLMQEYMGNSGTFWWFSFAALANCICVLWLVPETKGRSLEDITRFWISGRSAAAPEATIVRQGGS